MDKKNTNNPSPTIHSDLQADSEAAHALLSELELDATHAEAVKGGEGANANIQNHPHQLSLR